MNNKLSRTALFDFHHFCVCKILKTNLLHTRFLVVSSRNGDFSHSYKKKVTEIFVAFPPKLPLLEGLYLQRKRISLTWHLADQVFHTSYHSPQLLNSRIRRQVTESGGLLSKPENFRPRVWINKKDGIFKQGDFSARFHFRGPSFHLQRASEKQSARKSDLHVRTAKSQIVETLLVKEEVSRTINDKT